MSLHNKKLEAFLSVSVEVWKRIQNQILIWQKFSLFFMFSAITAKSTTTFKKKSMSPKGQTREKVKAWQLL